MASEQISVRQSMGPKVGPMIKQPIFNLDIEQAKELQTRGI